MRKHWIDNLRWVTVLLVLLYHVVYFYNNATTESKHLFALHGNDLNTRRNVVFLSLHTHIYGFKSKNYG